MVFGKNIFKSIPYNSNIWNYNAQLYFILFFLSRLMILLFIFLLINVYYKCD